MSVGFQQGSVISGREPGSPGFNYNCHKCVSVKRIVLFSVQKMLRYEASHGARSYGIEKKPLEVT